MTIYFSGHSFKYEIEGICKLFFPIMRFSHIFEPECLEDEENFVFTRKKIYKENTLLWVYADINGKREKRHTVIKNNIDDYEDECERVLCILLYKALSKLTKISPSWGILTGVRPVAILQRYRKEGKSDDEIRSIFKEKYLVSDNKFDLALKTADVQTRLLKTAKNNTYSLYVSIPFCPSRCSYCSFVSYAINRKKATDKIDEYIDLLCEEIKETAKIANSLGLLLDSIYIGGGTPTAISEEQLKKVTKAIADNFDVENAREYTIEAGRADTITKEKLQIIKDSGAKRISVNPQTFNDGVLKEIGRKHTSLQAIDAYKQAKEIGFDCINMDFIAGLPSDTLESFKETIDKAIELQPQNITVHTLTIKRSADLFEKEGIEDYAKENEAALMTDYAQKRLIKAGYMPYYLYRQKNTLGNLENVGYSKRDFESIYNIYIMDEMQTILACGAGAVTKLVGNGEQHISRIFNFKYHFEYIDRFDQILKRKKEVIDFYDKCK